MQYICYYIHIDMFLASFPLEIMKWPEAVRILNLSATEYQGLWGEGRTSGRQKGCLPKQNHDKLCLDHQTYSRLWWSERTQVNSKSTSGVGLPI